MMTTPLPFTVTQRLAEEFFVFRFEDTGYGIYLGTYLVLKEHVVGRFTHTNSVDPFCHWHNLLYVTPKV
jgi:hypothetical protein